jgi:hypothetical protein
MKFGHLKRQTMLTFGNKNTNTQSLGNKYFDKAYGQVKRTLEASSANGIVNDANSNMSLIEPLRGLHSLRHSSMNKKSSIERKKH